MIASIFTLFPIARAATFDTFNFPSLIVEAGACEAGKNFLPCYFGKLYLVAIELAIAFAVVMILVGGLQWLMAIGNQSKVSTAKSTITGAVIGLILALTSYVLFAQINNRLVDLKVEFVEKISLPAAPDLSADSSAHFCEAADGDITACDANPWCQYDNGQCKENYFIDLNGVTGKATPLAAHKDPDYRYICCVYRDQSAAPTPSEGVQLDLSWKRALLAIPNDAQLDTLDPKSVCKQVLTKPGEAAQEWTRQTDLKFCNPYL